MTTDRPIAPYVLLCLLALAGWATPIAIWTLNARGLTLGSAIPYGNDSFCDVWFYFGLATLGDSAWTLSPHSRYVSRVAAYFPDFLLGKLLPWNGAERHFLLNHSLAFIGATLAVLPLYGLGAAVLSAVLISTSALWIARLSLTYPTDTSLAFGMLALACLARAAVARQRGTEHFLCLVSGVLLGWAANASLMVVLFFPFLPLILLIKRDWRSAALYRDIALITVGGMLGTVLAGLSAVSIGQPFTIFWYQLSEAVAGIGNWWHGELIRNSVAIPLSVGLSIALICMLAWVRDRRSVIVTAIVSLTTLGIFAQTFIAKGTSLIYDAFTILFLVPAVLGVAELIRNPSKPVVAALTVIIAHIILMTVIVRAPSLKAFYLHHSMSISIACVIILLATLPIRRRRYLLVASLFLLFQGALGAEKRAHWIVDPRKEKDRYDVTEAALAFVRDVGISQQPVIWITSDLNKDMMVSSYRSFGVHRCELPARLPDSNLLAEQPLAPGALLVVLSAPHTTPNNVVQVLRSHAMGLHDSRERIFSQGDAAIQVTVAKIVAIDAAAP